MKLAQTIADMALRYVVITSVDRDDLRDGGAQHFADCITAIREKSPQIKIETLVPDFRGRMDCAEILICTSRMCSTITWKTYRVFTVRYGLVQITTGR